MDGVKSPVAPAFLEFTYHPFPVVSTCLQGTLEFLTISPDLVYKTKIWTTAGGGV